MPALGWDQTGMCAAPRTGPWLGMAVSEMQQRDSHGLAGSLTAYESACRTADLLALCQRCSQPPQVAAK